MVVIKAGHLVLNGVKKTAKVVGYTSAKVYLTLYLIVITQCLCYGGHNVN